MSEDSTTPSSVQVTQQQIFSRSDVATTKRALQDLTRQITKLQGDIVRVVSTESQVSLETFQEAWRKREQLNQLNVNLADVQQQLNSCMPQLGKARLTEKERTEIRGLYQSGLYTQQQLADQYGVTQPSIGDIVRG